MYSNVFKSRLLALFVPLFIFGQGGPAPLLVSAQAPVGPARLEVVKGSRATFRVREQLAGVDFLNDAVGVSEGVTGAIVVRPDGTVDASQSRLTVDVGTFT